MELNIINLIEKNSITRLNKEYENKLVNKIKDNFTDDEQKLFLSSFFCYLNYDSKKDFVIDFDSVWKWCGFTRKDSAKKILDKHFTENIDYEVFRQVAENSLQGGRPSETIMLTIHTFKKFCLKANTKKADDIHDYYIKLEELIQETINEETYELKEQLQAKSNKINELSKYVVRKFTNKYREGNCVYFVKSSEISDKIKIGSTSNINYRLTDLSTGSPYYFEVIELFYTEFYTLLEKSIKEIFSRYRISVNCEWYDISIMDEIKKFIVSQIELYNQYKKYSNIETINDLVNESPIYVNNKECVDCKQVLKHNSFYFIDKDKRIYYDKCITCYKKEHGDNIKQCSTCVQIKDIIDFSVDKTKKDGLTYECKECRNKFQRERAKEIREEKNLGRLICEECNENKLTKMFFTLKTDDESVEYNKVCKECYNKKHGESKQCFTCKDIKLLTCFDVKAQSSDGHETYCKTCRLDKARQRRAKIKEERNKENKNIKECLNCKEGLEFNNFFKIYKDDDVIEYYDTCMRCYTPDSLQCNRCHIVKDKTQFSKDCNKKTGYRTICKVCTSKKRESVSK